MGGIQRNITLGFKQSKKEKCCFPSRFFFFLVVINNIVTKQRTSVGAKRWQESQQSNETQLLKCRPVVPHQNTHAPQGQDGHSTDPPETLSSYKAARKQAPTSLLLIWVLSRSPWGKLLVRGGMVARFSAVSKVTWSPECELVQRRGEPWKWKESVVQDLHWASGAACMDRKTSTARGTITAQLRGEEEKNIKYFANH